VDTPNEKAAIFTADEPELVMIISSRLPLVLALAVVD
jgi:hypothetical protein